MSSTLIINNSGLFTHQGIQELFYKNNIADVTTVTIFPEFIEGQLINRAYIQVEAWHETEAAFNFIKEMQSKRGAIISSDDENENYCIVKTNKNKTKTTKTKTTNQKQNNNQQKSQRKYTKHFASISKQNLEAQIQEYEAEREQEMQEARIQIEIAIPMF